MESDGCDRVEEEEVRLEYKWIVELSDTNDGPYS